MIKIFLFEWNKFRPVLQHKLNYYQFQNNDISLHFKEAKIVDSRYSNFIHKSLNLDLLDNLPLSNRKKRDDAVREDARI